MFGKDNPEGIPIAGGRGEAAGQVNAKYGNDPGVPFYTHVSDQYSPFHTKVINATVPVPKSNTHDALVRTARAEINESTAKGLFARFISGLNDWRNLEVVAAA